MEPVRGWATESVQALARVSVQASVPEWAKELGLALGLAQVPVLARESVLALAQGWVSGLELARASAPGLA